jgi:hypothetical protein
MVLVAALMAGQWVRTPELVAAAKGLDAASFEMISSAAKRVLGTWLLRK